MAGSLHHLMELIEFHEIVSIFGGALRQVVQSPVVKLLVPGLEYRLSAKIAVRVRLSRFQESLVLTSHILVRTFEHGSIGLLPCVSCIYGVWSIME